MANTKTRLAMYPRPTVVVRNASLNRRRQKKPFRGLLACGSRAPSIRNAFEQKKIKRRFSAGCQAQSGPTKTNHTHKMISKGASRATNKKNGGDLTTLHAKDAERPRPRGRSAQFPPRFFSPPSAAPDGLRRLGKKRFLPRAAAPRGVRGPWKSAGAQRSYEQILTQWDQEKYKQTCNLCMSKMKKLCIHIARYYWKTESVIQIED